MLLFKVIFVRAEEKSTVSVTGQICAVICKYFRIRLSKSSITVTGSAHSGVKLTGSDAVILTEKSACQCMWQGACHRPAKQSVCSAITILFQSCVIPHRKCTASSCFRNANGVLLQGFKLRAVMCGFKGTQMNAGARVRSILKVRRKSVPISTLIQ